MNILLSVDGSEHTKRMLGYVAAHDEFFGLRHHYEIVTIVAPIPTGAAHFHEPDAEKAYYQDQADEVLRPVKAFAERKGWSFGASHVVGHSSEEIASLAKSTRADLIVMGTHGHTAPGNLIVGSVATGVMAPSKVPVLLVR